MNSRNSGIPWTPYNGTKLSIFDRLRGLARCLLIGIFADLDGNPRVIGRRIDMGAYEYPFIYEKPDVRIASRELVEIFGKSGIFCR